MRKWLIWITLFLMLMGTACAQTISPTTGLPIEGEPVAPMLVVISNTEADVKYNGHTTTAQGVGKRQAWGAQNADIIYEAPLYQDTATRLTYLFHDAIVNGETIDAGPIRSPRILHVQLTQMWKGGLIYASGYEGNVRLIPELADIRDVAFSDDAALKEPYINRVQNRAPDHRSADVRAIHGLMPDTRFQADPLVFTDEKPSDDLPNATEIKLTWGTKKRFFSRFAYDEEAGKYQWYSNKVPMKTWTDASRTEETELFFDNVIVQHVPVAFPSSRLQPESDFSAGGRAQILTNGKLIEAKWINQNGRIHYTDENGHDIPLKRGKTYVAIWPDDLNQITVK